MKYAMGIVLALGMIATGIEPCRAETIESSSRIIAVTVFPDRATVTRRAEVTLASGESTVAFGPLPGQLEPESVTARGSGAAKVTLDGVRIITTQLEIAQDPKVHAVEEAIQANQRKQRSIQGVLDVLTSERKYLDSIQAASGEQLSKELVTKAPSAADASSLLAFLDEALLKNVERRQQAET